MVVRIWAAGLAVIGVAMALLGVSYGIFIHKFNLDPRAIAVPRPLDSAQAQRHGTVAGIS